MSALGELKLEEGTYFDFVTHRADTGAVADADSGPTAEVFEDATDTTVVALTVTKRTSKTGNYRVPVTAAAADGFEIGKTYNVVASATVNSVAGKGVIGRFKVRARGKDDLAYPATSGRSLDVDASGRVTVGSIINGAIAAATFAANALDAVWATATRVLTAATNITSTGGTTVPQTGDSFARLGAPAGASVSADVAAVKLQTGAIETDTQDIQNRLPAALTGAGNLKADAQVVSDKTDYALTSGERTAIANEVEAQIIDDTDSEKVLTAITDKIASVNPSLDDLTLAGIASAVRSALAVELARIDVDISSRLAAAGYTVPPTAAAIRGEMDSSSTQLAKLGAPAGASISADIATRATPAQVKTQADQALTDAGVTGVRLAHLDADISTRATPDQVNTEADQAIADAALATAASLATAKTAIDGIKAKTDELVFTEAGAVDANVKRVNDVELAGVGTTVDRWRPT